MSTKKRPCIQSKVAREAGKSFELVVRDYANLGHSMTETAALLGYSSHKSFVQLCDRHGWREWFLTGDDTIGGKRARAERRGMSTPGTRRATRIALLQNPMYQPFEYQGVVDTWTGHAKRLGISVHTVRSRKRVKPEDLDYIFSKRLHTKQPSTKNHIWRKYYAESKASSR